MNKVEQYIKRIEEDGQQLTGYQKSLIYRCALIGITEEQMDLFVTSDFSVLKEELIIASIIDGLDTEYIRTEITGEDSADRIRRKRADYLMENFRSNDAEYNQLREELIILRTQAEDFGKVIEQQKKEHESLTEDIQNKKEEIKQLRSRLKKERPTDKRKPSDGRKETETRIITKYKRPSGFKETVYCLLGKADKLPEQSEEILNDSQVFFDMIIDSELSMEQIKEIELAYQDGIEIKTIKKIANKEFEPERMKALRKMICILNNKEYSETETDVNKIISPDHEQKAYERAVDDCMVITDESVTGYETDMQQMISLPVIQMKTSKKQ